MKKLFAALALAAVVAPVWAATQTVTLSVPGMTCSTCPIIVKKAISKVEGVSKIDVTFETDRKSTRLNSSHSQISYAVFCLKKKKKIRTTRTTRTYTTLA